MNTESLWLMRVLGIWCIYSFVKGTGISIKDSFWFGTLWVKPCDVLMICQIGSFAWMIRDKIEAFAGSMKESVSREARLFCLWMDVDMRKPLWWGMIVRVEKKAKCISIIDLSISRTSSMDGRGHYNHVLV